jgi:succinate dehydrogenase / fumarate reductase iron-sulfur subunit
MEGRSVRQLRGEEIRTITLTVKRWRPETADFTESTFAVQADRFTTILDILISVKEKQDASLSMRHSCNMGICGSCGMVINGKPRLACETNAFSLGTETITVGPMEAHPLVRDLVTDLHDLFDKHRSVKPWLVREDTKEQYRAEKEWAQTESQVDYFVDFAHCITCGLCVDACPVSNTNTEFVGPQALAQAHRYNSDSRDQGEKLRLDKLDSMEGVWGCEYAGACSEVCPKGVDPALTIQLTKLALMRYRLTGRTNRDKRAK